MPASAQRLLTSQNVAVLMQQQGQQQQQRSLGSGSPPGGDSRLTMLSTPYDDDADADADDDHRHGGVLDDVYDPRHGDYADDDGGAEEEAAAAEEEGPHWAHTMEDDDLLLLEPSDLRTMVWQCEESPLSHSPPFFFFSSD